MQLHRIRRQEGGEKVFCHSERSEESWLELSAIEPNETVPGFLVACCRLTVGGLLGMTRLGSFDEIGRVGAIQEKQRQAAAL
jgi:hypothetical protein